MNTNENALACVYEQITERVDGRANFRCVNCGHIVYRCKSEAHMIYAECGKPVKSSPTFLQMAANAANAAAEFARSGGQTLPTSLRDDRMAICRGCSKFEPMFARCGACGCFLSLKTWLPKEKCPLNKWPSPPTKP